MTDKEIIKALERCSIDYNCGDCPYYYKDEGCCPDTLMNDALDLINRQKAEIERLEQIVEQQDKEILTLQKRIINWRADIDYRPEDIKSEAIKEFAERLTDKADLIKVNPFDSKWAISQDNIDNLVKEMTEVSE